MLWLIGGTSESAAIAQAFDAHQIPYCVTVTTENARSLYGPSSQVIVGALAAEGMLQFVQEHQIQKVVDASHPFAVQVSQGAIATAQSSGIPYLRFERASASADTNVNSSLAQGLNVVDPKTDPKTGPKTDSRATVVQVPSLEALLQSQWLEGERSLLVLGYRMLSQFLPWQSQAVLYARILPSQVALDGAIAAGFTSDRLIALRPPISPALEAALWQQWEITQVVAKASGQAGGEDVKRAVAQALGVRLIMIDRPTMTYPYQATTLDEVLAFATDSPLTARPMKAKSVSILEQS